MKTFAEYETAVARTCPPIVALGMTALGLAGESGEFADEVKKHLFHGKELDQEKLVKELGDILWYLAAAAKYLGVSLSDIAAKNNEKLRVRYPDGFSYEASAARVDLAQVTVKIGDTVCTPAFIPDLEITEIKEEK